MRSNLNNARYLNRILPSLITPAFIRDKILYKKLTQWNSGIHVNWVAVTSKSLADIVLRAFMCHANLNLFVEFAAKLLKCIQHSLN